MSTAVELHGGWTVTQQMDNGFHVVHVKGADGKEQAVYCPADIQKFSFPKFVRKYLAELFGV